MDDVKTPCKMLKPAGMICRYKYAGDMRFGYSNGLRSANTKFVLRLYVCICVKVKVDARFTLFMPFPMAPGAACLYLAPLLQSHV